MIAEITCTLNGWRGILRLAPLTRAFPASVAVMCGPRRLPGQMMPVLCAICAGGPDAAPAAATFFSHH